MSKPKGLKPPFVPHPTCKTILCVKQDGHYVGLVQAMDWLDKKQAAQLIRELAVAANHHGFKFKG